MIHMSFICYNFKMNENEPYNFKTYIMITSHFRFSIKWSISFIIKLKYYCYFLLKTVGVIQMSELQRLAEGDG